MAASALFAAATAAYAAQPAPAPIAGKTNALGLPRLKPTAPAPLAKVKFDEDSFDALAAGGGRKLAQRGVEYLALDGGASWSRALRGSPRNMVFVSFSANASVGTEFEFAGAVLRVGAAEKAGSADLVVVGSDASGATKPRSFRCRIDTYNGKALAALPALTVRLDPAANVWDLYIGRQLFAYGLPLVNEAKKNARSMVLRPGAQGAQLCGLVVADENPLCVDTNANGIDDAFEIARIRSLLPAQSPAEKRNAVAKAWQASEGPEKGMVLSGRRPAPDRVAQNLPRKK